jgi:RNA polymerase subunit RPABC4/transcription elongation factor Spt4
VKLIIHPAWHTSRKSSLGIRAPQWARWTLFGVLIWAGIWGADWLGDVLPRGLGWVAWVVFGCWWIPTSLRISRPLAGGIAYLLALPEQILGLPAPARDRSEPIEGAKPRRCCPHCGESIAGDPALCPHCYRDLKANCQRCGRIIAAGHSYCPACQAQAS